MRREARVDPAWTFTQIIHGRACVFTFRHGVTEETAEGNVIEAVSALYAKLGSEFVPSSIQLASWLAGRTDGVVSVEVRAVIGHGAVASVVERPE